MPTPGSNTIFNETDQEIFDRELADFLPDRIFDAHMHLMHPDFFSITYDGKLPETCGVDGFRKYNGLLHPVDELGGLALSFSFSPHDVAFANQWCSDQVKDEPNFRCFIFVSPDDDPDFVRQEAQRLGADGFKVYHVRAARESTWDADIPEYMPEWLVAIADEMQLAITLHMVKQRGVADQRNIDCIRHYCETYPNMKLILAHSARGFQPQHNVEGLPKLAGIPNLYFDTSANCSELAHLAILKVFGHERLMYGSDFPVSHAHSTNFGVGDSFIWISEEDDIWNQKLGAIQPTLCGIEHLRSVKHACWVAGLSDGQVEDIFWNNAARFFDLR
jgi:glutamate-1-semialdehyde 2,1-aminomutase